MVIKNFYVFEGIDGAGTSTQLNVLRNRKETQNFLFTAEPTESETGRFLRRMLKGEVPVEPVTAAYLFAADRCEHIFGKNGVQEMINNGKTVVSDRYFFSSLAYQSVACGKDLPSLLNSPFPLPEYLFFFEINPEISLARVNARNEKKEIYEKIEMQKKIAALYDDLISDYEKNAEKCEEMKIIRIDASKSISEIENQIWNILKK